MNPQPNNQPMIQPRDYQQAAVDAVFSYWQTQPGYPLVVLPTAAGKTVIVSLLIQQLFRDYHGIKVLFMAHRKELIAQTEAKLKSVWPAAPVGVFSAALKRKELAPITVASRDTIAPALKSLNYAPGLCIVDEAHNISENEETRYRKIITELENRNPNFMLMGVTATDFRAKGYIHGKDRVFTSVAYELPMRQLIDQGYLAPLVAKAVSDDAVVNTDAIPLRNGDFAPTALEVASNQQHIIRSAMDEWERLAVRAGRRHTLFFAVSVAHAEAIQAELASRGYQIPLVTGKTPETDREHVCNDFLAGRLRGLINVGVFTEGTDFPLIDCICNLRAVHSLGLWKQMAGRGMRVCEGKNDCLVLDFGGCIDRFGPIDMARPPDRRGTAKARTKECPECESIIGFWDRACACGYEFYDQPRKTCPECQADNAPSADKCGGCGHIFINHGGVASDGSILSGERFQTFEVESVDRRGMVSRTTEREYLRVDFRVGPFNSFSKNYFLGYEGFAGERSSREFEKLCGQWVTTVADGLDVDLKAVEKVTVDMGSQYKDVVGVVCE